MRKGSGFRRSNSMLGRLVIVIAVAFSLVPIVAAPAVAANPDPADEIFFYRTTDGAFRFYNIGPTGNLGSPMLQGTGFSTGWSSITAIDLNGDDNDEMFFYRSTDGAFRYYNMKSDGSLGPQIAGGLGYSTGWSSITAIDLDGDDQDEIFFYRKTDGAYRFYDINPNGSLGGQILGGLGYSLGWDSITAVDLDGDGQDEMFFYRSTDGAYRYYNIQANAKLGAQILGGLGYSLGWDSITAIDLDGDGQDEMFFYRSTDGAYRYYNIQANAKLGALIQGGLGYSTGWSSITAVNLPPLPAGCQGSAGVIPLAECQALITLYNFTNGPSWTNRAGWLTNSSPCTWFGVTCSGGHVSALNLASNNLDGTIPAGLASLTDLITLNLRNNSLRSGIPNLSAMTLLRTIDLSDNVLTGSIPATLNSLTNLVTLNLHDNQITGSIPDLSALTSLSVLDLSEMRLTGAIPATLGGLTSLTVLNLASNFVPAPQGNAGLTGAIPVELNNLTNLIVLDLQVNSLTGGIPDLSALVALENLDVSNNNLTGAIPGGITITNHPVLDNLDLGWNGLSGDIPAAIWDLVLLTELDLSNNPGITDGPIPTEIGNLTGLTELDLSNLGLTGAIPAQIGNFPDLEDLHLNNNALTGAVPSEIGALASLDELDLSGNQLTGTIPASFDSLNLLETLNLSNNTMSGQIPVFFTAAGMPALSSLSLCGNGGGWTYFNAAVQSFVTGLDIRHNLTCIG